MWNVGTAELEASADILAEIRQERTTLSDIDDNATTTPYEFLLNPCSGILNSPMPLLPGCELKLSFDRAKIELSSIAIKSDDSTAAIDGTVVELKNLYLKAKYYSSPYIRNYFATIEDHDIKYNFDECSCYLKNLPTGETNIRLSNVIGGLTPKYIFAGVIQSKSLSGDFLLSSTRFERHGIKEFDLSLNGYSCNGFPLTVANGSSIGVYNKWLQSTNRFFKNQCGTQISPLDFKRFHYIYSHKFDGEQTEQGWLGINLMLENAYTENYTLGKNFYLL